MIMPDKTKITMLNVATDLNGAHDSTSKRGQSASDLGDALTNTLLDVRQISSSERRRRRRRTALSGAKQLVTRDARTAFKLVEVCTHLVLPHQQQECQFSLLSG